VFKTILYAIMASRKSHDQLALENVALRHQLEVIESLRRIPSET